MFNFRKILITAAIALLSIMSVNSLSQAAGRYSGVSMLFNKASGADSLTSKFNRATGGADGGGGSGGFYRGSSTDNSPPRHSSPGNSPSFNQHGSGTQGIIQNIQPK